MDTQILDHVIQTHGLPLTNQQGQPFTQALKEQLSKILGYSGSDSEIESLIVAEQKTHWLTPLEPIYFADDSGQLQMPIRLPLEFVTDEIHLTIKNETVNTQLTLCLVDHQLMDIHHIDDMEVQQYLVQTNIELATGEYLIELYDDINPEVLTTAKLIVHPSQHHVANDNQESTAVDASTFLPVENHLEDIRLVESQITVTTPLLAYQSGYQSFVQAVSKVCEQHSQIQLNNIEQLFFQTWQHQQGGETFDVAVAFPHYLAILLMCAELYECTIEITKQHIEDSFITEQLVQRGW